MRKLTLLEKMLVDFFDLYPNMWQDEKFVKQFEIPTDRDLRVFAEEEDIDIDEVREAFDSLEEKFNSEEDALSIDDLGAWVLASKFNQDELVELAKDGKKALKVLQDWKYYYGFRKTDAWTASQYADKARMVRIGLYELDPDCDEITYRLATGDGPRQAV